jgi:hypothetical protein
MSDNFFGELACPINRTLPVRQYRHPYGLGATSGI